MAGIFWSLLLVFNTWSQDLPDYLERRVNFSADSSFSKPIPLTQGLYLDPDTYILGAGDKLFISILGIEEINFTVVVDFEGRIFIPRVGSAIIAGKNLKSARGIIDSLIFTYYKNVRVYSSLLELRLIKVSVFGNVKTPDSYTLPSTSRLLDALRSAEWVNQLADIRNIKIKHRDGSISKYDLVNFFRSGNLADNPLLYDGDFIFIDRCDHLIFLVGAFKFPGIYEYRENETVESLVQLTGGVLSKARLDSIEVIRFLSDGKTQKSIYVNLLDKQSTGLVLQPGDKIVIRDIPEYKIDMTVQVEGFVRYPGPYKIIRGKTKLSDIIKEAGGFLENASLADASINREVGSEKFDPEFERLKVMSRKDMTDDEYDYFKSKSRLRKGRVVVDFTELFEKGNTDEDILLEKNDVIIIPEQKNYVQIIGQVVNPGKIVFRSGYTVNQYIELSGGFAWRALESDIRVIKANTGEWVDADEVEDIEPGDVIWVPEDPPSPKFWDVFTDVINITGQVATVIAATVAVIVSTR